MKTEKTSPETVGKLPKKLDKRVRTWAFVAYPDSAPEGWEQIIDAQHVPWCRSPLHDQDKNPDGEPKKAHWHCILAFEGVKTYEQVAAITAAVNGTIPQPVDSLRGYVRYLVHMDNPEKAQYSRSDIACFGGMDIADYLTNTKTAELSVQKEMLQYIIDNNVQEYEELVIYAMYNNDAWFESLANRSTYFINAFIKSRRNRIKDELEEMRRK